MFMRSYLFDITLKELPSFLEENSLVILDIWDGDCKVCKILAPELDKFAKENVGLCMFAKIKGDNVRDEIIERFNLRGVPTFIVFKDGVEIDRSMGFSGLKTFNWMKSIIESNN